MLALTVVGAIPNVEECLGEGSMWLYWMTWDTLFNQHNSDDHITEIYNNPRIHTVDSIVDSVNVTEQSI